MKKIIVCTNHRINPTQPSCAARGGQALADRLEQEAAARGWNLAIERFACLGRCEDGPNLKLAPGGEFYSHVSVEHLDDVLQGIDQFCRSETETPT